jgi:Zn-dependent metalloprotease
MQITEHAPVAFNHATPSLAGIGEFNRGAKGTPGVNNIVVHDARTGKVLPTTGTNADVDAVNGARNAGIVLDFYRTVLNRDSIDGAAMIVDLRVHDRQAGAGNAFWDGRGISIGDGDKRDFKSLAGSLDAIGHELTHGVTEFSDNLVYRGQSGALNESWSDVMGEAAQIWHEHPDDFDSVEVARTHDWSSGEDAVMGNKYHAISDLGHPERTDLVLRQPGHMKDYLRTSSDNGGVHTNSGIPSKAAYEVAQRLGTEKLAKIWYDTMIHKLNSRSDFAAAAKATIEAAKELYGADASNAVRDSWAAVGL